MTYEELLPILEKNGFYCEELTNTRRFLYVYAKSATMNKTDNRNILAVLSFNFVEPKLEQIQFYSQFYITKGSVATADTVTTDWTDNEITSEKIDKKCQKIALRIKTLVERAKLDRIKNDF